MPGYSCWIRYVRFLDSAHRQASSVIFIRHGDCIIMRYLRSGFFSFLSSFHGLRCPLSRYLCLLMLYSSPILIFLSPTRNELFIHHVVANIIPLKHVCAILQNSTAGCLIEETYWAVM